MIRKSNIEQFQAAAAKIGAKKADEVMSRYPEHKKLTAIAEQSQSIGEFIDWLQTSKGYEICYYTDDDADPLAKVPKSINDLLADYFKIDQDKLEEEKREMLELLAATLDK